MKTNVIFKNVGQGDSIILQVELEDRFVIGIIDCKLTPDKRNIVVEHLIRLGREKKVEVEFVVITHPHKDHYDGMETLFHYFSAENIQVRTLYHSMLLGLTVNSLIPKSFEASFIELLDLLSKMKYKKLVPRLTEMSAGHDLRFSIKNIMIGCYSPSDDEKVASLTRLLTEAIANGTTNLILKTNSFSNRKSAILKVTDSLSSKSVLLTSDSEESSFTTILNDQDDTFWKDGSFIAVQIPHHGSLYNYHEPFWKFMQQMAPDAVAVISVGKERKKHPDAKVLASLNSLGFRKIHTTGKVSSETQRKAGIDDGRLTHCLDYISTESYNPKNDFIC